MIFAIIFSGCLLFDAGLISQTCEDFFSCEANDPSSEPSQDSSIIDTSTNEPSEEVPIEYEFHPNEFTFYIEQSIFEQNVVNHQSWRNRITIVLFERDDMSHYPQRDMPSCHIFLDFDTVEHVEPNAQSFFGYNITSLSATSDLDPNSLCQDMDPVLLQAYVDRSQLANWSIGIGELTNSITMEYNAWIEKNEHDMLDVETESDFSDPFDFINTIYVKSDWSGAFVTLAPGVTLAYQSNAGGSRNQNQLAVLQNVITPPDGFYFSRSLFPYTLFEIPEETESMDEE